MWCGHCQSDVAAEVSPDNQRVFCAACGTLLSTIDAPSHRIATDKLGERTKDARELLQRWSSGKVIDPFGPPIPSGGAISQSGPSPISRGEPTDSELSSAAHDVMAGISAELASPLSQPTAPPSIAGQPAEPPALQSPAAVTSEAKLGRLSELADQRLPAVRNPLVAISNPSGPAVAPSFNPFEMSNSSKPDMPPPLPLAPPVAVIPSRNQFRIDAAHPTEHFAGKSSTATSDTSPDLVAPFASRASHEPAGESHRSMRWFPNFDPAVWRSGPSVSGGLSSLAGQFLAYSGVFVLTAGACMVMWSYFGGPANYAPTGWLLATAGQMLLLFGVVTLVSGGLEQTTEQVNQRIEQLGDHIIRIEQAAREISLHSGRSAPSAHFGHDPDAADPVRSAASGYERSVVKE